MQSKTAPKRGLVKPQEGLKYGRFLTNPGPSQGLFTTHAIDIYWSGRLFRRNFVNNALPINENFYNESCCRKRRREKKKQKPTAFFIPHAASFSALFECKFGCRCELGGAMSDCLFQPKKDALSWMLFIREKQLSLRGMQISQKNTGLGL